MHSCGTVVLILCTCVPSMTCEVWYLPSARRSCCVFRRVRSPRDSQRRDQCNTSPTAGQERLSVSGVVRHWSSACDVELPQLQQLYRLVFDHPTKRVVDNFNTEHLNAAESSAHSTVRIVLERGPFIGAHSQLSGPAVRPDFRAAFWALYSVCRVSHVSHL